MFRILKFLLLFLLFSCQQNNYKSTIVENNIINEKFLQQANDPEKALISMYLFAFGNECKMDTAFVKFKILKSLNIDNECNTD